MYETIEVQGDYYVVVPETFGDWIDAIVTKEGNITYAVTLEQWNKECAKRLLPVA